jgi:hypothetical protein
MEKVKKKSEVLLTASTPLSNHLEFVYGLEVCGNMELRRILGHKREETTDE